MPMSLANDDSGLPIDVPATAAGWLVRRHGGGRGRPAAVYDADGRPLVIALDGTAADLRAAGCGAGSYRLDAVDADRKLLGVTAYTELGGGEEGGGAAGGEYKASNAAEVAMMAAARAMEAMQRVQAERERALVEREKSQVELLKHLIDRLAPLAAANTNAGSAPFTWKDFEDYDRRVRKAVDVEIARRNAQPPPVEAATTGSTDEQTVWSMLESIAEPFMPLVKTTVVPAIQRWVWKKLGVSDAKQAELAAAMGADLPVAAPAAAPAPAAVPVATATPLPVAAAGGPTLTQEQADAAFDAVAALLDDEERDVLFAVMQKAPPTMLAQAQERVLSQTPAAAAFYLRTAVLPMARRHLGRPERPATGANGKA